MDTSVESNADIPATPHQLVCYYLHWPAPSVQFDLQGDLIEEPEALAAVELLRQTLAKVLKRTGHVGNTLARPKEYLLEIWIDPAEVGYIDRSERYVESLIQKWNSSCNALEKNVLNVKPQSANELGIRNDEIKVLEILARMMSSTESILISQPERDFCTNISSPSTNAINALPRKKKAQ